MRFSTVLGIGAYRLKSHLNVSNLYMCSNKYGEFIQECEASVQCVPSIRNIFSIYLETIDCEIQWEYVHHQSMLVQLQADRSIVKLQ